jgi:hypothetical protein
MAATGASGGGWPASSAEARYSPPVRREQDMKDPRERDTDLQHDEEPKTTKDWEDDKKRPGNQAFEDPEKTKEW